MFLRSGSLFFMSILSSLNGNGLRRLDTAIVLRALVVKNLQGFIRSSEAFMLPSERSERGTGGP